MWLLRSVCVGLLLLLIGGNVDAAKRVKRIVGGVRAAPPPPDDPVVFARLYSRNARVEGFRNPLTGLYSFLGIRYAEPPTGDNRFVRPRFRRLSGDINATQYGPPCPQPDQRYQNRVVGDEDCLLLNVFTPQMPDESSGLPVLIFIHGGGFRFGSANQYGPDPLTSQNMIFVPIQYRLGTLGIIGDGTAEFSGNVALFDMAAAVRWVHEYISFFGGDPKQVSIVGHGSGATSAVQLSSSDAIDDDMIQGVVAMSGSAYTQYAVDDKPAQSIREIAVINNCGDAKNELEIVKCLRKIDVRDIILRDSQVQIERLQGPRMVRSMSGMVGFSPVVQRPFDGRSLPSALDARPAEKVKNGKIRKIPLLTGVTKHETAKRLELLEIRSIFKNATDFLGVVSNALHLDGLLANKATEKIDLLGLGKIISLKEYLHIPPELDPTSILSKLTEATTDALFNLPALLTIQDWAKIAPSFLYSFEYVGHKSRSSNFLSGLPIVSEQPENTANMHAAHGDELGYLFDSRDIFGRHIEGSELTNATDVKVRGCFTKLIAEFVQTLRKDLNASNVSKSLFTAPATMGGGSSPSFIKIGESAEMHQDFRYCELSMWGVKAKPGKTKSCKFIVDQLLNLGALTGTLTGALGLPTLLPVLGGDGRVPSKTVTPPKTPNKVGSGGGLLGGLLRRN